MIDALRPDHLGCYGYERDTSPNIDGLAREALLFRNAYAQAPWTKPSIPTLFTSLYPVQHGVYEGEKPDRAGFLESDVLDGKFTTLAEAFKNGGYRTAAFVNNVHLLPGQGFAQGFDTYQQGDLTAIQINSRFLDFADREQDRSFFAYLHYLDVHWPFRPNPPFDSRFSKSDAPNIVERNGWRGLRDRINDQSIRLSSDDLAGLVSLYDGAIAELDHRVGELLDALRKRGMLENTIVLVTSDHGEELLDHGKVGHGGTLFEEVLRIPMILRLPAGARAGRIDAPARLLDVYPTLIAAARLASQPNLEGRDLLGAQGGAIELIAETRQKQRHSISFTRGGWKYIRTYRATSRDPIAVDEPDTSGLLAGTRVKITGWFSDDGTLMADKVRVKDPGDDDVEISGPIAEVDEETKEFRVHFYRVDPKKLMEKGGEKSLRRVRLGEWVKVEGELSDGMVLLADKLEKLPSRDRETELEGIIQRVDAPSRGSARILIGNVVAVVTHDTKIGNGTQGGVNRSVRTVSSAEDPFTPERLRTGEDLGKEELLFELGNDPAEQRNLAGTEIDRLRELGGDLSRWLERMAEASDRSPTRRERLDESTVERLRVLGYVE